MKPCCLPGIVHVKKQEIFRLGNYQFDSTEVCSNGKWIAASKGQWKGPPRNHLVQKFNRWMFHLHQSLNTCILCNSDNQSNNSNLLENNNSDSNYTQLEEIIVQDIGYQNYYLWYENFSIVSDISEKISNLIL